MNIGADDESRFSGECGLTAKRDASSVMISLYHNVVDRGRKPDWKYCVEVRVSDDLWLLGLMLLTFACIYACCCACYLMWRHDLLVAF